VGSHTRTTSVGGPAHLALTRAIAVAVAGALFVGCGGGDGRSVAATGTESESILADGASAAEENPEARDAVRDDSAVVHPVVHPHSFTAQRPRCRRVPGYPGGDRRPT
jgi:hypothetical protein